MHLLRPCVPAPRHAAIALACLCLPLTILAGASRADIRVPDDLRPEPGLEATLRVGEDAEQAGHVLRIPRHLLEKLAEQGPAAGGSTATPGRTRSIVAGIALSAAVACGLVAFRRRAARTAAAALVCLAVAGAVVAPAVADLPVPGGDRRPRPRPAPPAAPPRPIGAPEAAIRVADGIVVVVEATDGRELELVVGTR
jgi:hypothetical protein